MNLVNLVEPGEFGESGETMNLINGTEMIRSEAVPGYNLV